MLLVKEEKAIWRKPANLRKHMADFSYYASTKYAGRR